MHIQLLIDNSLRWIRLRVGSWLKSMRAAPNFWCAWLPPRAQSHYQRALSTLSQQIIRARSEGIKLGDRPSDPVELIVRRIDGNGEFRKQVVLRVSRNDRIDPRAIESLLSNALIALMEHNEPLAIATSQDVASTIRNPGCRVFLSYSWDSAEHKKWYSR
jgi:hypothetical protein